MDELLRKVRPYVEYGFGVIARVVSWILELSLAALLLAAAYWLYTR